MRPGYWAGEAAWPGPNVTEQALRSARTPSPSDRRARPKPVRRCSPSPRRRRRPACGRVVSLWHGRTLAGTAARPARGGWRIAGLRHASPLRQPLTILGAPVVELEVESDQPEALVAVRLNDLRPDGSDLRVTYGVLNLTHRDGHETPAPLRPGKSSRARADERDRPCLPGRSSHPARDLDRLLADHLAVAHSRALRIHTGRLAAAPSGPRPESRATRKIGFEPPVEGRATPRTVFRGPHQERTITRDVATNELVYTVTRCRPQHHRGNRGRDRIRKESGLSDQARPIRPARASICARPSCIVTSRAGTPSSRPARR